MTSRLSRSLRISGWQWPWFTALRRVESGYMKEFGKAAHEYAARKSRYSFPSGSHTCAPKPLSKHLTKHEHSPFVYS